MRRRLRRVATGALIAIAASTATISAGTADAGSAVSLLPTECDAACAANSSRLADLLEGDGGSAAAFLHEVGGATLLDLDADLAFYPASSIKTLHLVTMLRAIPAGYLGPSLGAAVPVHADSCRAEGAVRVERLGDLLVRMMRDSSNEATNALQDLLGPDRLAATAAAAAMPDTAVHHRFGCGGPANDPANVTTSRDLATLYRGIVDGTLLPEASDRAVFFGVIPDLADGPMIGGSPRPESVEHLFAKAGWWEDLRTVGGVIVLGDGRQFVFAGFTEGAVDPDRAIARITAELVAVAARPGG